MPPEIRPERVIEAFASFPPKLSVAAELLAEPERIFEEQAAAMGLPVPTGPTRMLAQALSGIEATLPAFAPPGFPAPTAPTTPAPITPTAPPAGGAGQGVSLGEVEKVEIERPSRTRERIEIVEA